MINLIYIDDENDLRDNDSYDIFESIIDGVQKPYDITLFNDPKIALTSVSNFGNNTIIILDIRMPSLNGAEFLKQLRIMEKTFPVIAYSANKEDEENDTLIKLLENDLFGYVKKNDHQNLVNSINKAIEKFKDNIPLELSEALSEYLNKNPIRKTTSIITKSGERLTLNDIEKEINKKSKIGLDYEKALYKMSFEKLLRGEKTL